MIRNALEFLRDQFTRASSPTGMKIPGTNKVVVAGGGLEANVIDAGPPLHRHAVSGLDGVISSLDLLEEPAIFYERDRIGIEDMKGRRESVHCRLRPTSISQLLHELAKQPKAYTPDDLVDLLRTQFPSSADVNQLIAGASRIEFHHGGSTKKEREHGKDDLGRQVHEAVQNIDEIPRAIDFAARMLRNDGFDGIKANATVLVRIDHATERFILEVTADEIDLIDLVTERGVGAAIRGALADGSAVKVINGTSAFVDARSDA